MRARRENLANTFKVLQQRKALGLDKAFEDKWRERELRELEERMELRPKSRERENPRIRRRSYSRERYEEPPHTHKRHRAGEDPYNYPRREPESEPRRPLDKRRREAIPAGHTPPVVVKSEPLEQPIASEAIVRVKREEGEEKEEGEISTDEDDVGEGSQSKGALALVANYGSDDD